MNSNFESGSPLNTCALESVSAGNLVASGWQVTTGTVDRIHGGSACATSTQPKFGDYCVDLCGTPASSGAISVCAADGSGSSVDAFDLIAEAAAGDLAYGTRKTCTTIDWPSVSRSWMAGWPGRGWSRGGPSSIIVMSGSASSTSSSSSSCLWSSSCG